MSDDTPIELRDEEERRVWAMFAACALADTRTTDPRTNTGEAALAADHLLRLYRMRVKQPRRFDPSTNEYVDG